MSHVSDILALSSGSKFDPKGGTTREKPDRYRTIDVIYGPTRPEEEKHHQVHAHKHS